MLTRVADSHYRGRRGANAASWISVLDTVVNLCDIRNSCRAPYGRCPEAAAVAGEYQDVDDIYLIVPRTGEPVVAHEARLDQAGQRTGAVREVQFRLYGCADALGR